MKQDTLLPLSWVRISFVKASNCQLWWILTNKILKLSCCPSFLFHNRFLTGSDCTICMWTCSWVDTGIEPFFFFNQLSDKIQSLSPLSNKSIQTSREMGQRKSPVAEPSNRRVCAGNDWSFTSQYAELAVPLSKKSVDEAGLKLPLSEPIPFAWGFWSHWCPWSADEATVNITRDGLFAGKKCLGATCNSLGHAGDWCGGNETQKQDSHKNNEVSHLMWSIIQPYTRKKPCHMRCSHYWFW